MKLHRFSGAVAAAALIALGLAACGGGGAAGTMPRSSTASHRTTQSVVTLASYNIASGGITAAGVSSGADMAAQLQYAFAKTYNGMALFAGSPYFCSEDNVDISLEACSDNTVAIPLSTLELDTSNAAEEGFNDPTSALSGKKAWLFSGTEDSTVFTSVVKSGESMDQHYGMSVTTNFTTAAGHAWISPDATNACGVTESPFLNNCGFDAEQALLTTLYGTLNPRNNGTLSGSLIQFNQNPFVPGGVAASAALDTTGYVFVPASCASGTSCRLMVALHGCEQGASFVGTAFVTNSGLNEWADTNNIIVLYPQAIPIADNELGCWDWWGYLDTNYASKGGAQISAIESMVNRLK
jgi:poly(3-hydroxybutyrate) depolymerase